MALAEIIYDTAANWAFNNPILEAGQIGVESDVRNGVQIGTAQAKMGDGVTRWDALDYWQPTSLQLSQTQLTNLATTGTTNGVKVYRALLTQTSDNAPVATVLEHTLGVTVSYTYESTGNFTAVPSAPTFDPAKTVARVQGYNNDAGTANAGALGSITSIGLSEIAFTSCNVQGGQSDTLGAVTFSDDLMVGWWFEILVYP